jgi:PTH2 family peptidyl-tRNA hydrolase
MSAASEVTASMGTGGGLDDLRATVDLLTKERDELKMEAARRISELEQALQADYGRSITIPADTASYEISKDGIYTTIRRITPDEPATPMVEPLDTTGKKLVVVMNHGPKMTRGKFAAQAVHAALFACGAHPETPVVVISGSASTIEKMPIQIRDAGRTELEPGTPTAGAIWIGEDERFTAETLAARTAPEMSL